MSTFDKNVEAFRQLKPTFTNKRLGKLGKYNDDGSVNTDISAGLTSDYSWVRFNDDRAANRVKNLRVRREWGTPVWVEYNELTKEDEVREVHSVLAPAIYGGEVAAALNSAAIPANVSTPVAAVDLEALAVRPDTASGGLVVRILAGWAHGEYHDGSELLTLIPTATSSKTAFVCVGIDSAGDPVQTLSTDRAVTYPFFDGSGNLTTTGAADIQTVMDAAPTTFWLWAFLLTNGATSIDLTKQTDLRLWRKVTSFTLAGDSGSSQTISTGDTLTVSGGVGLASVASATDTVTVNLDINSLTADASPDSAADYVATWDASASTHKKVLLSAIASGTVYYQTLRNNGSAQTQRGALNFIPGTNITFGFADDAGNNETEFTINASATPGGGAPPSICEGRLTLTTGTPITTTDVTAAGTVYFTPFRGNYIGLYSGSAWELKTFSELSISLSGLLPHSLHDVFIYNNSGTPTLELTAWTAGATGAITGATNATPIVITSTAHGLSTGDVVTISGVGGNTAANGTFRITNTGADTFSLQTLAAGGANVAGSGAYTSSGNWYKANYSGTRATALTTQDGIYVKTGATTRRYLGTIRITSTAGQCEDSSSRCLISNYYHPVVRRLKVTDTVNSHTYTKATYRAWNNDWLLRCEFVIGVSEQRVKSDVRALAGNSAGNAYSVGISIDTTSSSNAEVIVGSSTTAGTHASAIYSDYPGVGYHYAQWTQISQAGGTTTWYGDANFTYFLSGMVVEIWA